MEDDFVQILGFRHDYRLKATLVESDPNEAGGKKKSKEPVVPEFANNTWMYHVGYRLKAPEGCRNLKYCQIHDVILARLPGVAVMLDLCNLGSGRLLLEFARKLKKQIKGYTKDWTSRWYSEIKKSRMPARQGLPWFSEDVSNQALQAGPDAPAGAPGNQLAEEVKASRRHRKALSQTSFNTKNTALGKRPAEAVLLDSPEVEDVEDECFIVQESSAGQDTQYPEGGVQKRFKQGERPASF